MKGVPAPVRVYRSSVERTLALLVILQAGLLVWLIAWRAVVPIVWWLAVYCWAAGLLGLTAWDLAVWRAARPPPSFA